MPTTTQEVRAGLIGAGGPFEIVPETVDGIEMPVFKDRLPHLRMVAEMGAGRADAEFIVFGKRRVTFTEFFRLANTMSRTLIDAFGFRHGDRLAVLSANNPEWCVSFWGAVDAGGVLVGLNGWWKTDEILYGLQDSGSKVLVADQRRFERIAGSLDELPALEAVFLIDCEPADVGLGDDPRVHSFAELVIGAEDGPVPFPTVELAESDHAVIFYTSGTTGKPKGAISSHRNMIANLQNTIFNSVLVGAVEATYQDDSSEMLQSAGGGQTVSLLTSPLFHVAGCHSSLVVGTLAGVKLVIPEGKFEPDHALELIQDEGVTVWATVPTMVWRVCELPNRHDYDTTTVERVAFGGSPSADELLRRVFETFPNCKGTTNAYGLTESSSTAVVINGRDATDRPKSVGIPMPNVELRIDGTDEPGTPGEVLLKSPLIMPGYWGKPEATAESIRDGWLHSGDIGYLDEDGYLYITDRAKDMIIRGGENIYCVEIENRLVESPAIADAAVFGVPHPELGEEVKAVIELAPGASITEDEVRAWVADKLANFKVPTYVDFSDGKLPRNASGKLLKNVLRGTGEVSFAETM